MHPTEAKRCYRTVFLSDLHLGTRGCRSDFLIDFLNRVECERLFLVGDIVDGWRLRKSWYWDARHDEVIGLLLRAARNGTEVTYIPGNHDEALRDWLGMEIAGVRLVNEAVHAGADGRRHCGYPYWSLSQWLKRQVTEVVRAIDRCEIALVEHADGRFELIDWARENRLSFVHPEPR